MQITACREPTEPPRIELLGRTTHPSDDLEIESSIGPGALPPQCQIHQLF